MAAPISDSSASRGYTSHMKQLHHRKTGRIGIRATVLATALGAFVGLGLVAHANADDHDKKAAREAREIAAIRAAVDRGELVPLPRILALAQAQVAGDVVKTELETHKGRLIYEVKILTATGRVREVTLDARTGDTLSIEDD